MGPPFGRLSAIWCPYLGFYIPPISCLKYALKPLWWIERVWAEIGLMLMLDARHNLDRFNEQNFFKIVQNQSLLMIVAALWSNSTIGKRLKHSSPQDVNL